MNSFAKIESYFPNFKQEFVLNLLFRGVILAFILDIFDH